MTDNTNNKIIKKELYYILAEAAEDIIFILDKEGNLNYINAYGAALLESQQTSLVGKNLKTILPDYFDEIQKRNLQIVFRLGKTVSFIDKINITGNTIFLDTKLVPIKNPDNQVVFVMGIARDITNKMKADEEIHKTKSYLENILNNAIDLIFTLRKDGLPGFVNPKVKDFIGYSIEEAQNKQFIDYIPENQKQFVRQNFEKAFAGENVKLETDVIKADGSIMHCYAKAVLLKDYDELLISVLDITDRKKMEEKLRQITSELQAIFKALPDVYFRLDNDGTILDWKAQDISELYLPPSEFMHKKMQDLLPEDIRKMSAFAISQVARHRKPLAIEYSLPLEKGRQYYEARILPLLDDQLIIVSRNITERKKTEEELQIANLIIENSPVILFIRKADLNGAVEYVTKNVSQFGYQPNDFYSGKMGYNINR
jgi:PAS domain S-box-containing protein